MNRVSCSIRLALTAAALLGLNRPAGAQEVTKDRVPFKTMINADVQAFVVPGNPTTLSLQERGAGDAPLLGAFTWVALYVDTMDEAAPVFGFAQAVGALTAANGDAIYVKHGFSRRPVLETNPYRFEGTWIVTGGKGRFAGATGSGINRWKISNGKFTIEWEGMISPPEP